MFNLTFAIGLFFFGFSIMVFIEKKHESDVVGKRVSLALLVVGCILMGMS